MSRLRSALLRIIGGPSVIVLGPEESAVVFTSAHRDPIALHIPNGEDLGPGTSLAAAVWLAAKSEPGRLVTFLDTVEAVKDVS